MRYSFAVKVEPSTAFQQLVTLAPITAVITIVRFDALVTYDTLDSALSLGLGRADPSISHWSCDFDALVNYNIRDSALSLDLGRANPSISPSVLRKNGLYCLLSAPRGSGAVACC